MQISSLTKGIVMARKTKAAPAKQGGKAAQPAKKTTAIRDKMSKAQILSHVAVETGLTRAQVGAVVDELEVLIMRHIKKRSVGEFTLPGLMKISSVRRPATKKRMGRNPATGEQIEIAAKPATTLVRIRALKRLKEMVL